MHLKAIIPLLMLSTLFVTTSLAFTNGPTDNTLTLVTINPAPVSAQLSTHQLSSQRPFHLVAANKAFFVDLWGLNTVDIYNADTDSWSVLPQTIPTLDSNILVQPDDYLVFWDTAFEYIHSLNAHTEQWNSIKIPDEASLSIVFSVGNYVLFTRNSNSLVVLDLVNSTWIDLPYSAYNPYPLQYENYMLFPQRQQKTNFIPALDTAKGLASASFSYGDVSKISPSISVTEGYLVIAGGVDNGLTHDFNILNINTNEYYSGNMPSARYSLTIQSVDPLMLFIGDDLIESFNLQTGEWQSSLLPVPFSDSRVSTGHKLFLRRQIYLDRVDFVQFDASTLQWSNLTFPSLPAVGNLVELKDLAVTVNSDNLIMYNPSTDSWSQAQFSSGRAFKTAFTVGDKVLIRSWDDRTVDVTTWDQLVPGATNPTPTSNAPHQSTPVTTPTSSTPVASTPSVPTPSTTVPWSPWTPPLPAAPTSGPTVETPTTTLPSPTGSNAPVEGSVPSLSPVSTSTPTPTSTPVTVAAPVSSDLQQVSSASLLAISVTFIASVVVVILV